MQIEECAWGRFGDFHSRKFELANRFETQNKLRKNRTQTGFLVEKYASVCLGFRNDLQIEKTLFCLLEVL